MRATGPSLRWGRLRERMGGVGLRARAWKGSVAAALMLLVALPLISCDDGGRLWRGSFASGGCPRPATVTGVQPQFGAQAVEVRALRRRAFRGDFFSQLELARRYEGLRTTDKNLEDPVEAAVWYAMALANSGGFDPVAARPQKDWGARLRAVAHFDDCRAWERGDAYTGLNRLLGRMASEERDKVRDRVIYVLYSQGADGYRTLARLHDTAFGPFGEPLDNTQARWAIGSPAHPGGAPATLGLFIRNDVDAYLYTYLAAQTGDVGGYVLMKDFERVLPQRGGFANLVQAKADRWIPPYEFYPPEAPQSGVPHTDESLHDDEGAEAALARLEQLPFVHIAQALTFLRASVRPAASQAALPATEIKAFQAMIGRETTGWLSPIEKVRAIQYAATNGSTRAQLVLAVMYSEGVGVAADYARAFHWFEAADRQGSPEAKFAMASFFSTGVTGVANQDRAKSVIYQLDSALAGFRPSAEKLQAILNRVYAHAPRRYGCGSGCGTQSYGVAGYGGGGYPQGGPPYGGGYPAGYGAPAGDPYGPQPPPYGGPPAATTLPPGPGGYR